MNDYVAKITLDLNCQATPIVISAGQYDIGRQIKISLFADGEAYDATGATAVCKGKSGSNYFAVNAAVAKNIVTVTTDKAMLSSAGRTVAKIVLTDGTRTYSTQPFVINTHSDYDGDITTSDYYPELLNILSRVLALTESGAVLTDTNLSATSVNPLQNKVLTPIINTINNRLQSAEQNLYSKANATDVSNALKSKEDTSNKVSSKTDITDRRTNYPSIEYLGDYYYDANESYSSAETDELLGNKADSNSVYSKVETDNLLGKKANKSDIDSINSRLQSTEATLKNKANTADMSNGLASKADKSTTLAQLSKLKDDLVNTVGYKGTIQSHSYSDINDIKVNGVYVVDKYTGISNLPFWDGTETPLTGTLIVMSNNNAYGKYRLIQTFLGSDTKLHYRYCWNNTWSAWDVFAYATDIKKLQDYVDGELSSFEEYGKCSDVIKNVKVFGMEDNTRIIISNIRHNYVEKDGQTVNACIVYMSDNSGSAGSKIHQITFSEENGHISKFSIPKISENAMISFDYKLSEIADGSRVSGTGVKFLVKKSCYFPRIIEYSKIEECENLMTSFSMFEKFAVIGDSYSSGEIYVPKGDGTYRVKDYYELSWCQMLARRNGISCINMSSGGLHTRSWLTAQRGLSLLQSSEPQNLYIVALGINDANKLGESYIGAISDIYDGNPSQNADSFYGNYGRIIEAIKEKSPLAKIIVFRCKKDTGVYAKYNIAISAIGKHYNLPVINQNDDAFFESSVYSTMVQGHPTAMGYSGMSLAFERLIDRCMRNNIDYFKDYDGLTSLS